jgi:hypothetical protein
MSKPSKIKLTIKGGGLSYAAEVDPEIAAKVMALCLPASRHTGITPGNAALPQIEPLNQESIVEYLSNRAPRRNPDKILTMAGYMKEVLGKSSFHPNEIRNLFKDASEVPPANFSRDFRWTIRTGWIAKDPLKKDSYYVTNTGLRVLKEGFSEELVKKSKNKASRRRKKKATDEQ